MERGKLCLRRGGERMELAQPLLLLESGLVITPGRLARFDAAGAFPWVVELRRLKQHFVSRRRARHRARQACWNARSSRRWNWTPRSI